MKTLSIALRNLVRNARRSIVTLLGVGIGSVALLLFGGYKANINYALQTGYVRLGGHLQIQHKDYFLYGSGNPVAYGIADYSRIIDGIRNDAFLGQMAVAVTPTLQFGGIAGNYSAGVSRAIIGKGVDAPEQVRLRAWNQYGLDLTTPDFPLSNTAPNSAVVGLSLARTLQLCDALKIDDCPRPKKADAPAGDVKSLPADIAELSLQESRSVSSKSGDASDAGRRVDLLVSNPRGAPNVVALNVVGAESQGFKEFDEVYLVLHLKQAQRLIYGATSPSATSIIVQLGTTDQMGPAKARIASMLDSWSAGQPLAVLDFRELNPFYVQSIGMFDTIFGFMFVLIGSIVMFTVSNTMNTAVIERTVEVGTLRAIGVRQAGIQKMFITEGVVLGVVGSALGVVLALIVSAVVNRLGLHWLPPGSSAPTPLALALWGETGLIVGTTLGLIAMATVSAWWPAYRAARLNVVDALRHV